MPHLSSALRDWLQRGHTKRELTKSGLSAGYITDLFNGQLPKVETMGKILECVSDADGKHLLAGYLQDQVPGEWTDRVEFEIKGAPESQVLPGEREGTEMRSVILKWLERESRRSKPLMDILRGIFDMAHGIEPPKALPLSEDPIAQAMAEAQRQIEIAQKSENNKSETTRKPPGKAAG